MINRKDVIKQKGFSMSLASDTKETVSPFEPVDFSKIRIGVKTLEDAVLNLGDYGRIDKRLSNKEWVLKAIHNCDYEQMREISNFFYKTSGIYSRLCRYMAYLYRYDWMVTPYINEESNKVEDKVLERFYDVLTYLDNFGVKKFFGEVALKVIRYGSYYGYLIPGKNKMTIQELPSNYCRTRFSVNGRPAVEFNMRFFDDYFKDTLQRMRMLNMFPQEFKKGYILFKEGKLVPQFAGDTNG